MRLLTPQHQIAAPSGKSRGEIHTCRSNRVMSVSIACLLDVFSGHRVLITSSCRGMPTCKTREMHRGGRFDSHGTVVDATSYVGFDDRCARTPEFVYCGTPRLFFPLCPEQRSATFFLSFFPVQRSAPFSRALSHAMKWSFFTPFFPGSEAQDSQRLPRFCRNRHPPPPSLSRLRAYTRGGRRLFDALLGEWHCIGS